MTRRPALPAAALAALLAAAPAAARAPAAEGLRGRIEGKTTWSGEVALAGDVEIPEGASLVVEAGTRVSVATRDATGGGWNRDRVEIHVRGEILVSGTPERPVLFECGGPAVPAPETVAEGPGGSWPWHGIVLWPAADARRTREIRGALFSGAWSAVQVPKGKARIEGCVFLECLVGVEAGSAWADDVRYGLPGGVARPVIAGCRFAGCGTGVYAERGGAPLVERSVFSRCSTAAGNERRRGHVYPLQEPGVTLDRCDVHRCTRGVQGPSLVTGSLFAGNGTALVLSDFHTRTATGTDLYACRGNVFCRNGAILAGESVAGDFHVADAPGYAGEEAEVEAALRAPWPPLPACLRLRPDAPARGKAADGGDPGCLSPPVVVPAERAWTTARARLLRPLAAEPPGPEAPGDPVDLARLRPSPGAPLQRSWWCRLEAGEDGTLRPRAFLGRGEEEAAYCWRAECSSAGPAELEVNGDLLELEAWWNGEPVKGIVAPRRFDGEGGRAAVAARPGINVLVVRARGRGPDPRLGVALAPPPGGRIREAADAAPGAREARVTEARLVRDRERGGDPFLRLALSTPLAWTARGIVRLLDPSGEPVPAEFARVRFEDRQVLFLGPLPDRALRGGSVSLEGFRGPDGAPVEFPSGPFAVPPLPVK